MRNNSISVIIPTYCGKTLLAKYLPLLIDTIQSSLLIKQYEIIVVDDASKDDTVEFLSNEFPSVILLQNNSNLGFSKSINKGLFAAKYDLVLLLNDDMIISSDFFEMVIPFFEKEDTFGVFSQIRDDTGENIIEGIKLPIFKHGTIHYKDNLKSASGYTLYLCGGNSLIDKNKLIQLNGLNEIYSPFYFEDFDISITAWRRGWKCYYTDQTFCKHCHSVAINTHFSPEYVQYIFTRNKLIFNYLNSEKIDSLRLFSNIICKIILSFIIPSKSRLVFRKSALAFLFVYPQVYKKKLQRNNEKLFSVRRICADYFNISR